MSSTVFSKPFTQQREISDDAIAAAVAVLKSGRLHRYNTVGADRGAAAEWEADYAAYQGSRFCLATSSGGAALQIAMRAAGVGAGDKVLTNAFTLAPVPGAIAAIGAEPVFVEVTEDLIIDQDDLAAKLEATGARVLLLSHMRGHIAPMEPLCDLLARAGAVMIEDCAHTMGARWNGRMSGNFGLAACFSTQTYKHLNSGEGGLLTSDDADLMARATILSGSYMMYEKHGAGPATDAFADSRYAMPNCSARMDNLRAAILRPQLNGLEADIEAWNVRYRIIEAGLSAIDGLALPTRPEAERYVGSSIQFLVPDCGDDWCRAFVASCGARGVELKWFGDAEPVGFTSRYDSWRYADAAPMPQTLGVLKRLFDMRIPLTFDAEDCRLIARIIGEEFLRA